MNEPNMQGRGAASASAAVAIVGCRELIGLDGDWPLLHDSLAALGVRSVQVAWDDPAVDWSTYPLAVVRGTWDYVTQPGDFRNWARRVDAVSSLVNPLRVIEWNLDKRYLADLSTDGVATVPTQWVEPEDEWTPPGEEFVVKPSISGGAKDTARYRPAVAEEPAAAQAHVSRLQREGRTVMVQPYLAAVDAEGELAMIFFAGKFSHAVRKGPLLQPGAGVVERLWETETLTPATPSAGQRATAEATVAQMADQFGAAPTYCRVDLVSGPGGDPWVLEVELIDPALFLDLTLGAADRFAAAITAVLT